jgi:hypothetical protein
VLAQLREHSLAVPLGNAPPEIPGGEGDSPPAHSLDHQIARARHARILVVVIVVAVAPLVAIAVVVLSVGAFPPVLVVLSALLPVIVVVPVVVGRSRRWRWW